jgi:hypothetical protein
VIGNKMKVSSAVDFSGLGQTHLSERGGNGMVRPTPPVAGGGQRNLAPYNPFAICVYNTIRVL